MRRSTLLLLVVPAFALSCSLPQRLLSPTAPPAPTLPPAHTPTAPPEPARQAAALEHSDAAHAAAMRPEFVVDLDRFPLATRYLIEVEARMSADAQQASLSGHVRILFSHPGGEPLEELALVLWPNDPQYSGTMRLGTLRVDGVEVQPQPELGDLAVRIPLPAPLRAGESLALSADFTVDFIGVMQRTDPRRFGLTEGMLLAPTFYPMLPRLVDGRWRLESAPPGGDTTNSDTALYIVRITRPGGLELAATGVRIEGWQNPEGTQTETFASGPVRDFAFALGPFLLYERDVDGVLLRGWVLPQHTADAERLLQAAADQLRLLGARVGPYPYTELDLVDAPHAFGGIEYPGLVFIGTLGTPNLIDPVVHEVAHQWFYGLIGSDQLEHPWMDEAAASYAEVLYYEAVEGPAVARSVLEDFARIVEQHARDPHSPIGRPVGDYVSEQEYAVIVYLKGALFFAALREAMGEAAFFDFLQAYDRAHRYGFALPQDFAALAEQACACDLAPLFALWVEQGGPRPSP